MGWSKKPSDFILVVEKDLSKARREVAVLMLQGVLQNSPVDTGRFRGNNIVSINSDDVSYDYSLIDSTGVTTLQKGTSAINSDEKPYSAVVIQNNLPYADALENGHSGQAPQGVYGVAFVGVSEAFK